MDKEYRYMIYNEVMKEYQFPRICETTEKGATTCLFNMIGNDARKHRFKIKRLEKELAYKIRQELKYKAKANRIHRELENINYSTIYNLVIKNDKKKTDIENLYNECSTIVEESNLTEEDIDRIMAETKETQRKAEKYDLLVEKLEDDIIYRQFELQQEYKDFESDIKLNTLQEILSLINLQSNK